MLLKKLPNKGLMLSKECKLLLLREQNIMLMNLEITEEEVSVSKLNNST